MVFESVRSFVGPRTFSFEILTLEPDTPQKWVFSSAGALAEAGLFNFVYVASSDSFVFSFFAFFKFQRSSEFVLSVLLYNLDIEGRMSHEGIWKFWIDSLVLVKLFVRCSWGYHITLKNMQLVQLSFSFGIRQSYFLSTSLHTEAYIPKEILCAAQAQAGSSQSSHASGEWCRLAESHFLLCLFSWRQTLISDVKWGRISSMDGSHKGSCFHAQS